MTSSTSTYSTHVFIAIVLSCAGFLVAQMSTDPTDNLPVSTWRYSPGRVCR